MSETQSTSDLKRRKDAARAHTTGSVFSCGLLIAGAFVLLATVFGFQTPPAIETPSVKGIAPPPPRRVDFTPQSVFEVSETHYRLIIENNLFRPLGWTPPRPTEPYRLIGEPETCVRRDHTPTSNSTIHHRTSNIYRDIRLKPRRGHRSGRHPVKTGDTLHAGAAPHPNATERFLTSLDETPTSGANEGPPAEQCWQISRFPLTILYCLLAYGCVISKFYVCFLFTRFFISAMLLLLLRFGRFFGLDWKSLRIGA